MEIKRLFQQLDEASETQDIAYREIGHSCREFRKTDYFSLLEEILAREIKAAIGTGYPSNGDDCSLMYSYIKGLQRIIDSFAYYESEADKRIAEEINRSEQEAEDTSYVAGLEAGPDSGTSSVVR